MKKYLHSIIFSPYICNVKQDKRNNMFNHEFTIFKKGVTEAPVKILSKEGEPFNKVAKIQKYTNLGYTVTEA